MSSASHALKRVILSARATCRQPFVTTKRCLSTIDDVIREGDVVILRRIKKPPLLVKPLKNGESIGTNFGTIQHNEIIGKNYRDTVKSSTHKYARIHRPTLGEYTTLTPRLVTPVYPADANLLVSLLDIHVDAPRVDTNSSSGPLEILEAGTGHGALTLHLARAIHAANPPRPMSKESPDDAVWRKSRQAVVHTLDISRDHSLNARKVVNGFRNGLYAGNVDFHIGSLDQFIDAECQRRNVNGMMFHHILLDLPGTHNYVMKAAQALKPDGVLIVFSPSVTQIAQCVEVIRKNKLPLSYDQVVELGAGYGGGKQWDVRLVPARNPKANRKLIGQKPPKSASGFFGFLSRIFGPNNRSTPATSEVVEEPYYTVCRPSVGHRVVGGGFVGVWRRKKDWERFDEEDEDSTV